MLPAAAAASTVVEKNCTVITALLGPPDACKKELYLGASARTLPEAWPTALPARSTSAASRFAGSYPET
jgi:hypothetical protein